MSKILITGALGNVGAYAAHHALANGQDVKVADINLEALMQKYENQADCVYFDFKDPSTFQSCLENVDRVFIVRPPHLGKPEDLLPFIEALQRCGTIKMITFLSLIGIEKNPMPPHYKIEKYIEKTGLPYCHIRPSFFMQNISGIHAYEIQHFDRIVVPVGKALTSFIDADDVGRLVAKILSEPHAHHMKAYSITGPEALNYWEVAIILSQVLKRKIIYANPKMTFAKNYWTNLRGIDPKYVQVMGMLYWMTRLGTAKRITTEFEEIMGVKPQSFSQFALKNKALWE